MLEIRIFSFLIFREFLRLKNPDLDSLTVDPFCHVSEECLNFFDINYLQGDIYNVQKKYDLIFIDGDHSYYSVKRDFEVALQLNPKYILFHDIVDFLCVDVVKFWNEIKNDYKYEEFVDQGEGMGLGLLTI